MDTQQLIDCALEALLLADRRVEEVRDTTGRALRYMRGVLARIENPNADNDHLRWIVDREARALVEQVPALEETLDKLTMVSQRVIKHLRALQARDDIPAFPKGPNFPVKDVDDGAQFEDQDALEYDWQQPEFVDADGLHWLAKVHVDWEAIAMR